ncbi:cysteine desulfurase family protein [Litoribacter populi]|uniref:cysteine desulfurase family protein n=1 Tax=Litoribacter populi TaxID=2598460 RepID=UPI00117E946D|nr:cysteine desulfurase family protein [Litoribacter populi]
MISKPIYLDFNSTTPCDPRVVENMLPYFTQHFGNSASKDHFYGWQAQEAVDDAREQVAGLIRAKVDEIIFTSGATEAINLALKGLAENTQGEKTHIITCKTEHAAVLDTCVYLESKGFMVTYLKVNEHGEISLQDLEKAITPKTLCLALMWANNETGVIHPIDKIAELANRHNVAFFCDATQAVGKIPIDVKHVGIDLMAFSSHKMYGPKGVGALYFNQNSTLSKIIPHLHGGSHEWGLRSGSLNVPGIVGFGHTAKLCRTEMATENSKLVKLRDRLETSLLTNIPGSRINGLSTRLPQVTNLRFPEVNAENLLLSLSQDLALSRGSACSSNVQRPSHVLKAMGLTDQEAFGSIRISLGRFTTEEEVEFTIDKLTTSILSLSPAQQ